MKIIVTAAIILLCSTVSAIAGDVYVKGHIKDTDHDGVKDTYVNPYYRTSPNNTTSDNYTTNGNYNPYTGTTGNVIPSQNTPPVYVPSVQPPSFPKTPGVR